MKYRTIKAPWKIIFVATVLGWFTASISAQVSVINMVPVTRSGETCQDSETSIALNPANPLQIAGSAFTWDNLCSSLTMSAGFAPIYVSQDGGVTWSVVTNVPSTAGATFPTGDITLRFSGTTQGTTNTLFAGILHSSDLSMQVLRTIDFRLATPMTLLDTRTNNVDQPHTWATTVMSGSDTGKDRVYVGFNNGWGGVHPQSSTVDFSLDGGAASPTFNLATIEKRSTGTAGQDGFATPPAANLDGTVYVAFYGWRASVSAGISTDVVVVRDDNWATGVNPFTALTDTDTLAGKRVVQNVVNVFGNMGQQRLGASNLAIAVDPRDSSRVYVAWGDQPTSTSNQTLHVRRSVDRGVTWSTSDLVTVANAISPALAINSRGKVGFLYQELTGSGTSQRWKTRLRRTTDPDASVFDAAPGLTLSDTSASIPTPTFQPYLGDYDHLVAYNQDFYGVFSANNTPDPANFPNGVSFSRYSDTGTHTLFADAAHTSPVSVSIDPFFFHVTELASDQDFYVRDWTLSSTSGDSGAEPSTFPWFYAFGDVWNRRGTLDGTPFPNDQPTNEDAGNGSGNIGDNWAFARIRRNAGGGAATATAHFLVSEFGTGSNFSDSVSGNPNITFDPTDPTISFLAGATGPLITPAYHWHLDTVASNHLCLAVEISTATDPYIAPSLAGFAPGWPTTDLRIINDNNKAQRNMGLSTAPARGVGGSPTTLSYCGIVHNPATERHSMTLHYEASPEILKRLGDVRVGAIGSEATVFRAGDSLTLKDMLPGENRWVCATFAAPRGREGEILPFQFVEMENNVAVNGFAIGTRLASLADVIQENVRLHQSGFARAAALFKADGAIEQSYTAERVLKERRITEASYLAFLNSESTAMGKVISQLPEFERNAASFGLERNLKSLQDALRSHNSEAAAVAHTSLLNMLDAYQTMEQLSQGDPADILQMVRWQKRLYSTVPELKRLRFSASVVDASQKFISGFGRPTRFADRATANSYSGLVKDLLRSFQETAALLKKNRVELEPEVAEIEKNLASLRGLEKAHRNYLLKLAELSN